MVRAGQVPWAEFKACSRARPEIHHSPAPLLLRNTAAALGLALMWAFVIEGILPVLIRPPGIVRWLPEAAANAVLHGTSATATTLPAGAALPVLAGYTVVLATGGALATTDERSAPPQDDQPPERVLRHCRPPARASPRREQPKRGRCCQLREARQRSQGGA